MFWEDEQVISIEHGKQDSESTEGFMQRIFPSAVNRRERRLELATTSGRYEGEMPSWPRSTRSLLDLRIDIDRRYNNSPVMNRISGDFYQVYPTTRTPNIVYRESWIVDNPIIKRSDRQVTITGTVRFWEGSHPTTNIRIVIPAQPFQPAGQADISFTSNGNASMRYICTKKSDCFRHIKLEVDVTQSVNVEPILPIYHTHSHEVRPSDLHGRILTIEEAYREAGICMSISPERTVIDDSDNQFEAWNDDELHDAMVQHFSQIGGTWPKWEQWGLLCGSYDDPLTGGIMFDAAAEFGGPDLPPERQGFAVFRNHQWFNDLVSGNPTNQNQAWAMRQFLYTFVHEAGHAFNFVHSWDKGRDDALSWMNYPQRVRNFWNDFTFRFDDEELIHLRHGNRASVIMGGDPWASGRHLQGVSPTAYQLEEQPPLELLLRSKEYFDYLEPVSLELRLRNLVTEPVEINSRLNPEYGFVVIYIQKPTGNIIKYVPVIYKEGLPIMRTLASHNGKNIGEDRYSENVSLTYGKYGFYFDEPGEYLVRSIYRGIDDMLIPSNTLRIRVGNPTSKEESRLAADFFTYQAGMVLYLRGSQSPLLLRGKEVLESVSNEYQGTIVSAKVAVALAESEARPFFRIQDRTLKQIHSPDYKKALKLTEPAVQVFKEQKQKVLNLAYHQLVRHRADAMLKIGEKKTAKDELSDLRKDLASRGVNETVLNSIKSYEESLDEIAKTKSRNSRRTK